MTFDQIESSGLERWLGEVTDELRQKTCLADPVRRVRIPKPDGTRRPLGIPTIRDRVVQTAMVIILDADSRGGPAARAVRVPTGSQRT